MIFWEIFWVFFRLGFISFGGVIGVLPVLQSMVVDQNHWMNAQQFLQAFVIGQFVPGPNMAMGGVVGYWVAGIGGWAAALLGIYSGPLILMKCASTFYEKHKDFHLFKRFELALRPLALGLISASLLKIFLEQAQGHLLLALLFPIPIVWLYLRKKISALVAMFVSGVVWWTLLKFF